MPGKALFPVEVAGEYHQIHISKAKAMWSFPKGSRFPRIQGSYCSSANYDVAKGFEAPKKGTNFGYGNRFKQGDSRRLNLT